MERTKKKIDMDYEQKYNEALERARANYKADKEMGFLENCDMLELIFPELAESEDERIRMALIKLMTVAGEHYVRSATGFEKEQLIAWLEKQKEQKPLSTEETELNSIAFLEQMGYTCIPPGAKPADNEEKFESIDNAFRRGREVGFREGAESVKPVEWSEHQHKLLNYAISMTDDREVKKFLELLRNQPVGTDCPQEWSEEDEEMLQLLISYFGFPKIPMKINTSDKFVDFKEIASWLKSLPERFNLQPKQEWSEEDEDKLFDIQQIVENFNSTIKYSGGNLMPSKEYKKELIAFLKSLRPQPHWKPSEEQMKALYCALNDAISLYSDKVSPLYEEISRTHFDALESLYNDLKKLK